MAPYKIAELRGGGYRVKGPSGVHAKRTSLKKAKAQIRIMQAAEHGREPKEKK